MEFAELLGHIRAALPEAVLEEHPEAFSPWILVARAQLPALALLLRDDPALDFAQLMCLSGTHLPAGAGEGDRLASIFHLFSPRHRHKLGVKVVLDSVDPACPSVAGVWPTADWHEREAYDLLGIVYEGHPDLRRILCPDDWEGHPLRKDYVTPATYNGMPLD
ncbi:MAG: NADH-quinone oxidoreductase subunit C [Candidatus Delongbacteria bacterium]